MTGPLPICLECRHLKPHHPGLPLQCAAFPEGIPQAILVSQVDHREPFPGDHGRRFQPKDRRHVGARTQNPFLLRKKNAVSRGTARRILPAKGRGR